MGAWQAGVSLSQAGPSEQDHALYASNGHANREVQRVDVEPRQKKRTRKPPRPEVFGLGWAPPICDSQCAVAVTRKGLQFMNNGERLETLLPR